jgi:hypothetical protein
LLTDAVLAASLLRAVRMTRSTDSHSRHSPCDSRVAVPLVAYTHRVPTTVARAGHLVCQGWFYIPWQHRPWVHLCAFPSWSSPQQALAAYQCKPSSRIGPLGRISSVPPGRLSACERTLDSQQRTTRSSLQHLSATVNIRYEHLCSQQILVCPVAHHSGHPQATSTCRHAAASTQLTRTL